MDFQSAARFGERRVMVTDYDETAVEVNAKVVDEDTGEVICECESGGGGDSDFGIANVTFINTSPTGSYNAQNVIYVVDDEELDKGIYVGPNETITMPIVLYKGISRIAIIPINQEVAPTLTGSITYDNETRLFVCTGDGSITCEGTGSNQ